MNYITRITRLTILPESEPIFSEMATHVETYDETGGEYIAIKQDGGSADLDKREILINPEEWPLIAAAVNQLMNDIKTHVK